MSYVDGIGTNLYENFKISKGYLNLIPKKITIIGCDNNGTSCAVALMHTQLNIEICLIDLYSIGKANAEMLDLQDFAPPGIIITSSADIQDACASDIYILSYDKALLDGLPQPHYDIESINEQMDIEYVAYNVREYIKIIPILTKISPNAIFIVATYPTACMSYVTWKYSKIPINRIIGLGTSMDTIHYKLNVAKYFDISPLDVNCYVIGSITCKLPVWSAITIAGASLVDENSVFSSEVKYEVFVEYITKIFKMRNKFYYIKGHPYCTTSAICCRIVKAILTDSGEIFTVGTKNVGFFGMKYNVFISLPCTIRSNGIHSIVILNLNLAELIGIQRANKILFDKIMATMQLV